MESVNNSKEAIRISIISIILNAILSIVKAAAGFMGRSSALISDAIHSLSDVLTTIVVIIGIKISTKEPDKEHPYGHEKLESIASIILAISLFAVGLAIGVEGIKSIYNHNTTKPELYTLVIAIVSIAVKEVMFWVTIGVANKVNSQSLKADAWHHRSDALSSIGSFIGILLSYIGFRYGDTLASIIICLFIIKVAFDIMKESIDNIIDHSCDNNTENEIREIIRSTSGVDRIDDIKTRKFGSKLYVDVEIAVDGDMRLIKAHNIAEDVHHRVETAIKECKHCMVHINPIN